MNIRTKERLVTGMGLAAIGIIAAMIWWTYSEVESADRQRRVTSEIALGFADLRLVTFDYRLYHTERAQVQWGAVSDRVDRLIANARFVEPVQMTILAEMRGKRTAVRGLFAEITAARGADRADAPLDKASLQFETQLLSQMLSYQQENLTDAFRLNNLATEHIIDAQQRMMLVILSGLALIAAIIVGTSWFLRRNVLAPIAGLQQATREVAAGNWDFILGMRGGDEIGELSKNFDAMTQSLRKSFAQAEHSNQALAALNEELEAFSYSVSHDLRAPLRSMDGFSLLLIEDYGDKLDEEGRDALERIRAASQRMGYLIDDLLRLSQVTRAELNVTRVDLSAIAREIADALDREQPGRSVEWAIEAGLSLSADPALMRIAMQNLLQNAWKFTGRTDRPVIRVGALERDAKTVYFVADNGVGFDMAYADRLFGAFQRLHHAGDFPGTGIGLAIVQRIIRRHDGEIRAEAKEGAGATFFFSVKESENGSDEQDHPAG
ncbi:MAG: ATP-binding protein [Burkholderiales bacterium]|nr:ATP-binding protein [Burkholderiales bacterium]